MKRSLWFELEGPDSGYGLGFELEVRPGGEGSAKVTALRPAPGDIKVSIGGPAREGETPAGFVFRPVERREGDAWEWHDKRDPERDRELDRLAARDHVMFHALSDIAADCGGPILDAGQAAQRAKITLERIGTMLTHADPKGDEIRRLRATLLSLTDTSGHLDDCGEARGFAATCSRDCLAVRAALGFK